MNMNKLGLFIPIENYSAIVAASIDYVSAAKTVQDVLSAIEMPYVESATGIQIQCEFWLLEKHVSWLESVAANFIDGGTVTRINIDETVETIWIVSDGQFRTVEQITIGQSNVMTPAERQAWLVESGAADVLGVGNAMGGSIDE